MISTDIRNELDELGFMDIGPSRDSEYFTPHLKWLLEFGSRVNALSKTDPLYKWSSEKNDCDNISDRIKNKANEEFLQNENISGCDCAFFPCIVTTFEGLHQLNIVRCVEGWHFIDNDGTVSTFDDWVDDNGFYLNYVRM